MESNKSRLIVYIEDDTEMIDLVTLILNRRGYQVKGAHGGHQGLDLVQKEPPDESKRSHEGYTSYYYHRQSTGNRSSPGVTHCQS